MIKTYFLYNFCTKPLSGSEYFIVHAETAKKPDPLNLNRTIPA